MPVLLLGLPIKREFDSYCLSKGVELFYFRIIGGTILFLFFFYSGGIFKVSTV